MTKRGWFFRSNYYYLLFATLTIFILSGILVYATGYTASQPSHTTLYADTITGKSGSTVTVSDGFTVNSDPGFTSSYGKQLLLTSTDASRPALDVRSTNAAIRQAASMVGFLHVDAPYRYAINVSSNASGPGGRAGILYGNYYTSNPGEWYFVVLANKSYAVYGANPTGQIGWIGGTAPFEVGNSAVSGLYSATRGGSIGTPSYGIYGQYDANRKGYLGGAAYGAYGAYDVDTYGYFGGLLYGAYGQYDASNYGYIGASTTGVYGRGTTYGGYFFNINVGTGYSGYFNGGQGVSVVNGGICTDNDGSCDPDLNGDGTVTADNHITGNSDVAEKYRSAQTLEPGDVVILDGSINVKRSSKAFDKLVAGIVSENPGVTLGASEEGNDGYPIALTGRVPVKASAENGAIAIGDLLTTSSSAGYAMKCGKSDDCFGAILGKALEPLDSGKGKILVLVALG